jgi:S-formylglutathione hydrolase FrmB
MATFAERFVAEVHGKPAPVCLDPDAEDRENHPETIYEGGLDTIAENCNVVDVDRDAAEWLDDDDVPTVLQAGTGHYFFKDGSKAGLRYHFNGTWDAWVMKAPQN